MDLSKLSDAALDLRLKESTFKELVQWHQDLRTKIESDPEGAEGDKNRLLLIKVQRALLNVTRSRVDSDNETYKKLMEYIQDQQNKW